MSKLTSRDQALFNLDNKISRFGWTAYYILGGPGPPWLYTLGLIERFGHPELITLGLSPESSHGLVSKIVRGLEDGQRLRPGRQTLHRLEGRRLAVVPVDDAHWQEPYDYFLGWLDYYEAVGRQVAREALQLVWADESDVLPWESGFDKGSQAAAAAPRHPADRRHVTSAYGFSVWSRTEARR